MYANETMPYYMAIGVSEERFWTLNPRTLKPYIKAHKLRRQMIDEQQFFAAQYTFEAVSAAISNINFGKHRRQPRNYMGDIRKDPMFEESRIERGEITEEERIAGVKNLFKTLGDMQESFERSKEQNPAGN